MSGMVEGEGIHVWILTEPGRPDVRIWGLTPAERLRRALIAAGVPSECIHIGPGGGDEHREGKLLLFRSDYVFDDRLVHAMLTAEATALVTQDETSVAAVHLERGKTGEIVQLLSDGKSLDLVAREGRVRFLCPSDLACAYRAALRKADQPYLLAVRLKDVRDIENRIFRAAYKGVTDLVTKWVWPLPARAVTRSLAHAGISPNTVTCLSWILVIIAAVLFARGWFGFGLITAWFMTFLDTVDGKLARVTLTSSRVGHVLDHSLDIIHPPFWYLAWALGLPTHAVWLEPATVITVGGYVIGRLLEGIFLLLFKMEIHSWRPIDSAFRTITARRNPNLILLTIGMLAGRPDIGLILVALWTLCSIGFHTIRLVQALAQRWRGLRVSTWQESETTA